MSVLVLNIFALLVLVVQFFTGFFIEPEIQIMLLTGGNILLRSFVGRDLFTGEIRAAVKEPYKFVPVKKLWYSKVFWVSIIGILGAAAQWKFGWTIEPESYGVILSVLGSLIGAITKEPVSIK